MKDLALGIIQYLLAPAAAALITWIAARRKSRAEAISSELANVEKAIGIYRQMAGDLEKEMFILRQEMSALQKQNRELLQKLQEASVREASLNRKIGELETKISSIKNIHS